MTPAPSSCSRCGRPIVWGEDEKGTRHAIDTGVRIFEIVAFTVLSVDVLPVALLGQGGATRGTFGFGSDHAMTCPGAARPVVEDVGVIGKPTRAAPLPIPAVAAAGRQADTDG